jgi:uncharacterized membrane protein YjgN (DUF898 family)
MEDDNQQDHSNGMLQPSASPQPPALPPEPESSPTEENIELSYTGRWQDIAKLALVNSLLTFMTLGIYSFWGRVRIRKYLWSHTQVNRSPLEYHGTGGQLFIGFLLITILFLVVNFGFQALQNALIQAAISTGSLGAASPIIGFSSLIMMTIYVAFFAYIIYSVRRYWLAMTSWRGIRLRQGGKRGTMLGLALPRALLTVVTLGFAYPWLALRAERYAYSQSFVGSRQFSFDAEVGPLVRGWLPIWLSYFFVILIPAVGIIAIVASTAGTESDGNSAQKFREIFGNSGPWIISAYTLIAILVTMAAYAFFRARLFNVGVSGISLGGLRFQGNIRTSSFLSAYVRAALLTVVLIAAPAAILFPLAGATAMAGDGGFGGIIAGFLVMLIYMSTSGFAWNIIVVHGLWKARVAATTTVGTVNIGEIKQQQVDNMRQGEGFGTAFDAGFGEA